MSKFFITHKDSETGKKFQEFRLKCEIAHREAAALAEKYGFRTWRHLPKVIYGGISKCSNFLNPIDSKVWKKVARGEEEYYPKVSSIIGRKMVEEFDALPIVTVQELNEIVGFKDLRDGHIGHNYSGGEYIGFTVGDKKQFTIPADCEEVTRTQYKEHCMGSESKKG